MSHVISSLAVITDLSCLREALSRWFTQTRWMQDKKTHAWYGQRLKNDNWEGQEGGVKPEDFGKCEHAIQVDGVNYEIEVVKRPDGNGWTLVWDPFTDRKYVPLTNHDGDKLAEAIGEQAQRLMVRYNQVVMERYAEQHGMSVEVTETANGGLEVELAEASA